MLVVDYTTMTTPMLTYPDPPLTDGTIRIRPWTMQALDNDCCGQQPYDA